MSCPSGPIGAGDRQLSAALDQWRGPVLDDLHNFPFVEAFATALAEDHMVMHVAYAEAEIACGRANVISVNSRRWPAKIPIMNRCGRS